MILLIDNYDSFVHNLARYLALLGKSCRVIRNDAAELAAVLDQAWEAIVISPGPCSPQEAGSTLSIVQAAVGRFPLLGVCLGHQAIVQALGGSLQRAREPVHGRTSPIHHDGDVEFTGLPNPFIAARYHSLIADEVSLPVCLTVSARTRDGTVMAVRHVAYPVMGWQFHPESILTDSGFGLLAGFLRQAGLSCGEVPDIRRELPVAPRPVEKRTSRPVTF